MKINKLIDSSNSEAVLPDSLSIIVNQYQQYVVLSNTAGTQKYPVMMDRSKISIKGPLVVNINTQTNFIITNFSSFKNYIVSAKYGIVNIVNDTITYDSPVTIPLEVSDTIYINDQSFEILLNQPAIIYSGALAWSSEIQTETGPGITYSTDTTGFITNRSLVPNQPAFFKLVNDSNYNNYQIETEFVGLNLSGPQQPIVTFSNTTGIGQVSNLVLDNYHSSISPGYIHIKLKDINNNVLGKLTIMYVGDTSNELYDAAIYLAYGSYQPTVPVIDNDLLLQFSIVHNSTYVSYDTIGDPYFTSNNNDLINNNNNLSYHLDNGNRIYGVKTSLGNGSGVTRLMYNLTDNRSGSEPLSLVYETVGFTNIRDVNNELPNNFIQFIENLHASKKLLKVDPTIINTVTETYGYIKFKYTYTDALNVVKESPALTMYIHLLYNGGDDFATYTLIPL